jgi:hypothetical protein
MRQALNTKDFGILSDSKKQTKKLHPFKGDRKSQGIRFQANLASKKAKKGERANRRARNQANRIT